VVYENPGSWDGQFLAVHTSSSYPLSTEGGSYVVYPEVRTIQTGNGWNDRTYSFTTDYVSGDYPASPPTDNAYQRGRLLNERFYDQSGNLIRKVLYGYTNGVGSSQMGIRHKPYYYDVSDNAGQDRDYPRDQNEVPNHADCHNFYLSVNSYVPYSVIDSVFSAGGPTATKTLYGYENYNNHLILNKVITTISGGATREKSCRYPFTGNTNFTLWLTAGEITNKNGLLKKNCLQPLEVVDSLKPVGSMVSAQKVIYNNFNSSDLHINQVRNYTSLTDSTVLNFTNYDLKGNLREQYKTSGQKEVYLWGYKGQYPVAKIIGSDFLTDSALVNQSILDNPVSDSALRVELDSIRIGLIGTKAMVTTYTYNPLIGMTSATDPSGKTLYYEYDALGRLIVIRDANNNIIKKMEYKLAGAL
jgi:YD repeat-containing protein